MVKEKLANKRYLPKNKRDRQIVPVWFCLSSLLALITVISSIDLVAALQKGDRGQSVEELQTSLVALGYYDGPITGFYGERTEAAVKRFQLHNGLPVDGLAGDSTLEAVKSDLDSDRDNSFAGTVKLGSQGDAVTSLQTRLRNLGYYSGPITGYFGELTVEAVKKYQAAKELPVDGVVGENTWLTLY